MTQQEKIIAQELGKAVASALDSKQSPNQEITNYLRWAEACELKQRSEGWFRRFFSGVV